jgi:DNA polymerase-3 subunit delta'
MLKSGHIPHALLFTGPDGVGRQTTAVRLAMAVNCAHYPVRNQLYADTVPAGEIDDIPCGQCGPCGKILKGVHPDITVIHPDGGVIKIAQIRELCNTLSMKPFEGRMRVAVLVDARAMNPSAGNALLKMLEEPPEQTLMVLIAGQAADLLPTIVSRCQHIRFTPISRTVLSDALIHHQGVGANEAMAMASLAGGSFSRALTLKDPAWIARRDWVIAALSHLQNSPLHVVLALSEKLSKNRDTLSDLFDIMFCWFRDVLIVTRDPVKVMNLDRLDRVREAAGRFRPADVMDCVDALQTARAHVEARTNVRLSMDHLLLLIRRRLYNSVTKR